MDNLTKEELYLPKPTGNHITEEQIQTHRQSLITSYNEQNYNKLRNQCRVNNLNAKGKKSELVERLAERTLTVEYGSPRMRNSYQTAMNSPLPITKKDTQPKSLQSVSSKFLAFSSFSREIFNGIYRLKIKLRTKAINNLYMFH